MKEQDYINVVHLTALRTVNVALSQITGALLATDEERKLLKDCYQCIDKLIESIRKRIKL